jgi:putative ABC transport system permease protein
MLRHYLSLAVRHVARNWLYGGIAVFGLAAGFAAAILIALYVRDEFSFERFIAGYEQIYRLETDVLAPGQEPVRGDSAASTAAAHLALDFPELEGVVRLARSSRWVGRDKAETWERVAWTDPEFFEVLPYPVLAGDPVAALHDANALVLTRQVARKYFGVDTPIGETLLVQAPDGDDPLSTTEHPMIVRAVLEDIPDQTHLEQFKIFASSNAAWANRAPANQLFYWIYARLPAGMPADRIRERLEDFAARHYSEAAGLRDGPGTSGWRFRLEPLKDVHFTFDGRAVIRQIAIVGLLIIAIAAINFVTLMTARAARRATEVGVRKAIGASRRDLIVQFMGEALLYVFAAMLLGMTIAGLALPAANTFLERSIVFDYLNDPTLALGIAGTALLTGLIAGAYPALVLSSFAPAPALKSARGQQAGSAAVRQGLVVAQFAALIVLIIGTATIYRQTSFGLENVLRLNGDQIVLVPCEPGFKQKVAALPDVNAAACISSEALGGSGTKTLVKDPVRGDIAINTAGADVGFFEMHGLQPLAGRFFSSERGEDMLLEAPTAGPQDQPSLVLNESAVRQLGFDSPWDAVGQSVDWIRPYAAPPGEAQPSFRSSRIIGVVGDFTLLGSIHAAIDPTMYFVDPISTHFLSAKVQGQRLPETLQSIDALWRSTGHVRPIKFEFMGELMRSWYRDIQIQGGIIGASAGLAIVIACLGLFALAAFTAERRTKEIGVRKAMGASRFDVVRLLLWQFTKPVLWANLIAWPSAYWATAHWLDDFAYRVSLPPWLFLAASFVAVLIAWVSVATKAWQAAGTKPVSALHYP